MLTQKRLKQLLYYEPELGFFMWLIEPNGGKGRTHIGDVAGYLRPDGYIMINIKGRLYQAHRLAWLYMTGAWPEDEIDHRYRLTDDNRFSELRKATSAENHQNVCRAQTNNRTSGLRGVSWNMKRRAWYAFIKPPGRKQTFLGAFADKHEAHVAYLKAKAKFHPFSTV